MTAQDTEEKRHRDIIDSLEEIARQLANLVEAQLSCKREVVIVKMENETNE